MTRSELIDVLKKGILDQEDYGVFDVSDVACEDIDVEGTLDLGKLADAILTVRKVKKGQGDAS